MLCAEVFEQTYQKEPEGIVFCPYRVCPLGAHSDHNLGKIAGFAIDKGIHIAYHHKHNGIVELRSLQFSKRAQWHIAGTPKQKENDWADYLRGATIELAKRHTLSVGISGVIEGSLPIGGLSSSAAVTISFLTALCRVNEISLSDEELISTALKAENNYVGVACGRLDQSCEVYAKKDRLLYLDTRDNSYELIPENSGMKNWKIAVLFSGVERSLAGSKFNMRVDEAKSAAYALKAYAGIPYGRFDDTYLRDVPVEVFQKYKDRLPENFRLRAQHWYTEFERVEKGVTAWRNGDIEAFGALSFESGRSSIEAWQTGSPELIALYEILLKTPGVYGGRFSGAGFKGCCMALIDPDYEDEMTGFVTNEYLKVFPEYEGRFSVHVCRTADGVGR